MKMLYENSLALTVNSVNDVFNFSEKVSASEKKKTAEFIADKILMSELVSVAS